MTYVLDTNAVSALMKGDRAAVDRLRHIRASWSDDVTETFGTIKATLEKKGQRIEDFDAAIAAHALASGAVLVTANTDHMVRIAGLVVEDWSRASIGPS